MEEAGHMKRSKQYTSEPQEIFLIDWRRASTAQEQSRGRQLLYKSYSRSVNLVNSCKAHQSWWIIITKNQK